MRQAGIKKRHAFSLEGGQGRQERGREGGREGEREGGRAGGRERRAHTWA